MCDITDLIVEESVSSKLIRAVNSGNFEEVKNLITPDVEVENIKDSNKDTLIHIAVRKDDFVILEYLLNLDKIDVDSYNLSGRTALLIAAERPHIEIVKLLIKKGADVNLPDFEGNTPLHCACYSDFYETCVILLENGADVNRQNNVGCTVLHLVCNMYSDIDWLTMLMYYGADPMIPSWDTNYLGYTPFEQCLRFYKEKFQKILLDYIVDNTEKIPVALGALVSAMMFPSDVFLRLIENVSEVIFDYNELNMFLYQMYNLNLNYLELFFEKFGYVLSAINEFSDWKLSVMTIFTGKFDFEDEFDWKEFMPFFHITLFKESFVFFFVENTNKYCEAGDLRRFFNTLYKSNFSEEMMAEMILHLLSYGMDFHDEVLCEIYHMFGYGKLFEVLLHMDIIETDPERCSLPDFIYRIKFNADSYFNRWTIFYVYKELDEMLDYFNHVRLKGCYFSDDEGLLDKDKANKLPNVPSLLQLARDASRTFIVKRFNVQNSRQFYTVLRKLPLCNLHKEIIALKRKIYST